jgi:carbon-monoxide dehydrogenase iron sulfur subunit
MSRIQGHLTCELKASVAKVPGQCAADPPMVPRQYFTVRNGDIRIPEGSIVCAWALHSLLPVITPKERKILESESDDWMWRASLSRTSGSAHPSRLG